MDLKKEIKEEKQEIKGLFSRIKKRDFSGNTGQAIKNSGFKLTNMIVAKMGSFLFTIIVARMLLPELFGLYALALSTIMLFAGFSDFGINSAIISFIGKTEGLGEHRKSKAYFHQLLKWKIIFAIFSSLALFLLASFIANNFYNKPIFLALIAGALYIPITALLSFFEQTFMALNNFKYSLFKEIIFQFLRLSLIPLGILLFISKNISKEKLIFIIFIILVLCYFIALLFILFLVNKKIKFLKAKKEKLTKEERKRLLIFLIPLSITVFAGLFFGQIDMIMLGHFVESSFIGFYNAAFSLIGSATAIMGFFATALFPIFSRIKGDQLERGFKRSIRISFLVFVSAAIFTYFIAPYLIEIIYGQGYLLATNFLRIFALLLIIIPISEIYTIYFIAARKTKTYAKIIFFSTSINVILNYLLIVYFLKYGMFYAVMGVCIATVISKVIHLGGLIIFRKKN